MADIRIENYLERLRNIINPPKLKSHEGFDRKQRNLEMLKRALHEQFVIKPENIPESYWESIKQRHREEGHGDIKIPDELKQELAQGIIEEQRDSLDYWIDYLASNDAKYPDELKYWAIRSILKLGRYDKEKSKFIERYGGAVSPFPELNQEALALVFAAMEAKEKGEIYDFGYDIDEETKKNFQTELQRGNFAKLYALAIEEFNPISEELLKITEGKWVKYPKGSNHEALVKTLKRRGTGWCIAQTPTATRYLKDYNLEIFYSLDKDGNPTIPRVVIVESDKRISEVRGVAKKEHMDEYITDVVRTKLNTLSDGKSYEKRLSDMKKMTELVNKQKAKEPLMKDDLVFLYEINSPIKGFGYKRDPRIAELCQGRNKGEDIRTMYGFDFAEPDKQALEFIYNVGVQPTPSVFYDYIERLRQGRNIEEDMLVIFECTRDEIAHVPSQINENTKAYVGPICKTITNPETKKEKVLPEYVNIFHKFGNLEHVYTSFPDKKIRRENVKIGGKSAEQLISEMEAAGINISGYAKSMLKNREFVPGKNPEEVTLICLTVADLGFKSIATTDQIYERAQILGLELCPADIGPNYRLKYRNQPLYEWIYMGMKQIADSYVHPDVFRLGRFGDGVWLDGSWTKPDDGWAPGNKFVFRLRPSSRAKFATGQAS